MNALKYLVFSDKKDTVVVLPIVFFDYLKYLLRVLNKTISNVVFSLLFCWCHFMKKWPWHVVFTHFYKYLGKHKFFFFFFCTVWKWLHKICKDKMPPTNSNLIWLFGEIKQMGNRNKECRQSSLRLKNLNLSRSFGWWASSKWVSY